MHCYLIVVAYLLTKGRLIALLFNSCCLPAHHRTVACTAFSQLVRKMLVRKVSVRKKLVRKMLVRKTLVRKMLVRKMLVCKMLVREMLVR